MKTLEAIRHTIVLLGSGIVIGVLSAVIDILSQWLTTVRTGYCHSGWYLNSSFCCWTETEGSCSQWTQWTQWYVLNYGIYVIFSLIFGCAACILVKVFAPNAKLSGIPEIKAMVHGADMTDFLSSKTLLIKTLGLCLAVGAGLWVGKEGPLVHVGACCMSLSVVAVQKLLSRSKLQRAAMTSTAPATDSTVPSPLSETTNESTREAYFRAKETKSLLRSLLPAAAAAGISVAFGTPIGGVVYALECVAASYSIDATAMWHSFIAAMAAAVSLQTVNPFHSGQLVLFQVKYDRLWRTFEVVPFAVLGVWGGLFGAAFIVLNRYIRKIFATFSFSRFQFFDPNNHPIFLVAAITFVTAVTSYPFIYLRMPSTVLIAHLFRECSRDVDHPAGLCDNTGVLQVVAVLFMCCLIGFVLTCVTYGTNVPAGILTPSMVCGALFGRAIGILVQALQRHYSESSFFLRFCPPTDGSGGDCITPGVYALVGAAAALTGVTRMTVSCVVIVCEFTGALTYVLPIMTGVMVSKWVADAFGRRGFDESWIHDELEFPLIDDVANFAAPIPERKVADIQNVDYAVLYSQSNVSYLKEVLDDTSYECEGFPVIESEARLKIAGYVLRRNLENALDRHDDDTRTVLLAVPSTSENQEAAHTNSTFSQYNDLRYLVDADPPRIPMTADFAVAVHLFQTTGIKYLLLEQGGMLAGMITARDVWNVLSDPRTYEVYHRNIKGNSESSSLLGEEEY